MSLRREAALLTAALQFLTRFPAPPLRDFQPEWVTRSARYFPLIGQLVGAIAALVFVGAAHVWPPGVAAALALTAAVLATGALHEDGLADTADGLFGAATAERRLEIMKDSRIGTYGVLALILAFVLKTALLTSLPPSAAGWVLVAAFGWGRAGAVVAMRATPYAPQGRPTRWTPARDAVRPHELLVALALAAWPLAWLAPMAAAAGVAGAALGAVAVLVLAHRRMGGHTGDVLGAVVQLAELGFLLGAAAVL